ncbi:hypothetical protein [Fictibacillus sp. BK138]|uniref:hypothetical protein n=1 Tax=Fictibacillus sp. BK138 TaxID=2512121 RepID=UPI00102A43F9|nr:hypothetical protein [Fictibacillus sp. BK138]RZT21395.1 hypothetical protein EV282_0457 [Fictibacillus sp. BK138]
MEKEELKKVIMLGLPIAVKYENIKQKRDSIVFPIFIGSLVISLILLSFLVISLPGINKTIVTFGFFYSVKELLKLSLGIVLIFAFVPVLNLVPLSIGSLILIPRNKSLTNEMSNVQTEFNQITNLPSTFNNTKALNKFNDYLYSGRATNLQECSSIYFNEFKQVSSNIALEAEIPSITPRNI